MNLFSKAALATDWKPRARTATVAGALLLVTACLAYRDYRAWLRLGAGGLPGNFKGWLRTTRLRLQMRDPLDMTTLRHLAKTVAHAAYLAPLPFRCATRPQVGHHPIPHRQLNQRAAPHLVATLQTAFDAAVMENASRVGYALSHFEKHTQAITSLSNGGDPIADTSHGEIAHIHNSDGSMHMILSPADAVVAVEAGWAELHGLAGRAVGLPATYLMIYAPQSGQDVVIVSRLLAAAIAYRTGGLTASS